MRTHLKSAACAPSPVFSLVSCRLCCLVSLAPPPPYPADVDGRLAIHYAAMNGHTMNVLTLAAYGADVNSCTKNGRTALHGACWNGHTQAALQLIEMGAHFEACSTDGATPLMDAARNGHHDTVTALVTIVGADVGAVDRNGRGCLHFAALNGHEHMVKTLVNLRCAKLSMSLLPCTRSLLLTHCLPQRGCRVQRSRWLSSAASSFLERAREYC
jgi:ankyrin repeat protein